MNKIVAGIIIASGILVGLVAVGTVSTVGVRNHAVTLENTTEKYATDISNAKYQANTKLANLESAIDSSNEQYEKIIQAITTARDSDFSSTSDSLTTAVNLIVENYPDEPGNKELYETYMYTVCDVVEQVYKTALKYNDSVKEYKTYCAKFPASTFLSIAGYNTKSFNYVVLEVSPTWGSKQYV